MKLSKEQIHYINEYLKHHKFKYWDIRFEVLDHIINTVENKMDEGSSFDDAMIEVHKSFGNSMKMFWNTGVEYSIFANGNGYKKLIRNKKKELSKKYKNLIFKEFKNFFKSLNNIAFLFVIGLIEITLFTHLNHKSFLRLNILTVLIPLIIYIYTAIKYYMKKNFSLSLDIIYGNFIFPFLMIGFFDQIIETNLPSYISYSLFTSYLIIASIWFYSSLKVYHKTEKEYTLLYKHLKLQ